jgi:hypothetical protein
LCHNLTNDHPHRNKLQITGQRATEANAKANAKDRPELLSDVGELIA